MIPLQRTQFPSNAVHAIGWEPIKSGMRGNIYVQFRDKEGNLTVLGYYKAVQHAIFAGLESSPKPGAFIHQNLKDHFEWVRLEAPGTLDPELEAEARANIDPTLPDMIYIPAHVPNTPEAIEACIDAQRIKPQKEGLFE